MGVIPSSSIILTVDDFRLLRIKLQLALFHSLFNRLLDPLGLSFAHAVHYDIVGITLKGNTWTGFSHPLIKGVVEEEIFQQGTDDSSHTIDNLAPPTLQRDKMAPLAQKPGQ